MRSLARRYTSWICVEKHSCVTLAEMSVPAKSAKMWGEKINRERAK